MATRLTLAWQRLPNASVQTGCRVCALAPTEHGRIALRLDPGTASSSSSSSSGRDEPSVLVADRVISALPLGALAGVLEAGGAWQAEAGHEAAVCPPRNAQTLDSLVHALRSQPRVSVGVVNVSFQREVLRHHGFGFLAPHMEGTGVLGMTWDSMVFPQQRTERGAQEEQPKGSRLTVMLGGAFMPEVAEWNEEQLRRHALQRVHKLLGIPAQPGMEVVAGVHRECIPQFVVGHHAFVARVERDLSHCLPGVLALGNSLYGVGVSDCVSQAKQRALAVLQ